MTHFVLVRHGETTWHADNRYAGRTDVPLTGLGRRQAAALGTWAAGQRLDAVLCSPLSRARLTAEPAAAALGLAPRVDERLCELDFGRGDGLTRGEMAERFPAELAAFLDDPVAHHLPGGEDPAAAAERAIACLEEVADELPDGRVLVVAHSTLVRLVLCTLLGIRLSLYRQVFPALENGALTELRLRHGKASLLRLNVPAIAPTS
ncbi:histidine phosphatase family protein [Streptomyces sp. SP18CS02]|uniref:histidine phosphatase family protein n=1 Tax=Streptomyces sp. SP18CS02 TaxID=3002531 RepID=UPI002E7784C8|nr:histidine phosphatase family protein [Streptomyces sp. SP18CS02]MEE1754720.1 histidine phosphatase family protein [Streptomyces sp. SP18CS02]